LKTDSGGTGLLTRHPIAASPAALGLLVLPFLRFGDDNILLGSGAEGEADCPVPPEDVSDELLEAELESSFSCGASVPRATGLGLRGVGDRPRGPLKRWGNPHLNSCIK
jgi:hypothetical protein